MIVCADDFGLRDDINSAILELCGLGKLSAVSCLVILERCSPTALKPLLAFHERVDIGLHLCLTDEALPLAKRGGSAPSSFPSFKQLVRRSFFGRLCAADLQAEISAQYDLFLARCGRRPDYIDGHLHVHQLPAIRNAVIEFVLRLPRESRPYVRNTCLPVHELWRHQLPWAKTAFIGAFGARFARRLQVAGIATNRGFAGIYSFRDWRAYPQRFPRFLACLCDRNGLLVVHPGGAEDWRRQEYATLRDFAFAPGCPNRFQHSH